MFSNSLKQLSVLQNLLASLSFLKPLLHTTSSVAHNQLETEHMIHKHIVPSPYATQRARQSPRSRMINGMQIAMFCHLEGMCNVSDGAEIVRIANEGSTALGEFTLRSIDARGFAHRPCCGVTPLQYWRLLESLESDGKFKVHLVDQAVQNTVLCLTSAGYFHVETHMIISLFFAAPWRTKRT